MDFTIYKYKKLIESLMLQNYSFQTFESFLRNPNKRVVILRHDVDLLPNNSLSFAKIQNKLGIKGSYYFRAVPESWDKGIILEISNLGHEIGYHYENLAIFNGNKNSAIRDFEKNLKALREIVSVSTICMHGSPKSKFDSREIWKNYNYRDYNIIGEPYFDVDYSRVFYFTDTGRRWDGQNVSVRDKVQSSFKQNFHSTEDIICALPNNILPDQIMFTFHPQRWHDNYLLWTNELVAQSVKNVIKKHFFVSKK